MEEENENEEEYEIEDENEEVEEYGVEDDDEEKEEIIWVWVYFKIWPFFENVNTWLPIFIIIFICENGGIIIN